VAAGDPFGIEAVPAEGYHARGREMAGKKSRQNRIDWRARKNPPPYHYRTADVISLFGDLGNPIPFFDDRF
jgi:hypothetical protein